MAAMVYGPGSKFRTVKNLGWIRRNWQLVERLEWFTTRPHTTFDGIFTAYLRDGRQYQTDYASFEVWKRFINRPIFRGLPVTVDRFNGIV